MQLRPYQDRAVGAVLERLRKEGDRSTLLVAPTGAGKTIMMAEVAKRYGGRVLILQHREELVAQNRAKFVAVNRGAPTTLYTAAEKRFAPHLPEHSTLSATFAMVPTLSRNLARMQPVDLVMVDESHHAMASTWRATLDRALELNPALRVFGVTATPNRADKQGLGAIFDSVADSIEIGELIAGGYLVRPTALTAEIGLEQQIRGVKRVANGKGDFDLAEVARLIDHEPITQRVVDLWRENAGDRQTIVFCATVAHARHVAEIYQRSGVTTGVVTGEDDPAVRAQTLRDVAAGRVQVVVNCMALTEGYDDQLISCVVLLRPSCFESTLVQMIGRGLRCVDPALHPGVIKEDCQILDFGGSLAALNGLSQILRLDGAKEKAPKEPGPPPMKPCKQCRAAIPLLARECVLCGYVYPPRVEETAEQRTLITPESITLRPLNVLLSATKFAWIDLPDRDGKQRGRTKIASCGKAWAIVTTPRESGVWHAFGAEAETSRSPRHLVTGNLELAMNMADAFLGQQGDPGKYGRGSWYMKQSPSQAQRELAAKRQIRVRESATMYEVACWLTAGLNRASIAAMLRDFAGSLGEGVAA